MARSIVEILIAAKDATGNAFRSARTNMKAFFGEASKFAAGVGIFDSFKTLGRFLKDAALDAARMVPELAAPFKELQDRWEQTRLEIGAGVLQLAAPIGKFALDGIDWVKKFVVEVTEEWYKLPANFDIVIGKIEQSLGEFIDQAQVVLARLGIDTGNVGERIANAGAAKVREGIRTKGNLDREFNAPDTSGPSAVERALAEQKLKEREQQLIQVTQAGAATWRELAELTQIEARLGRQLRDTNLTMAQRIDLATRQRAAQAALKPITDRVAAVSSTPQVIDRRPAEARQQEADRLAAEARALQAQMEQGNKTAEERLALEEQLQRTQAARLAVLQGEGPFLASRHAGMVQDLGTQQLALEAVTRRVDAIGRLDAEERSLRAVIADGAATEQERAQAQTRLVDIAKERAQALGVAATATEDQVTHLAALATEEQTLRKELRDGTLAVDQRRDAWIRLAAIEAQRQSVATTGTPEAPPETMGEAPPAAGEGASSGTGTELATRDPSAVDLGLPPDIQLVPAGVGDQGAEEIGIVREAMSGLGLDLANLTDQGWQRFGDAAERAAEQSVKAEGNVAKAALAAGKGALAGMARAKAKDAFIHAGKALADGLLGNPAAFAAAAEYTAAGVGWTKLASELGGGGGGGSASGGGAGGGSANGGLDSSNLQGSMGQIGGTIVFRMPRRALVDANNPDFQDMLADAAQQQGFRNVVFEDDA